jgi:hypothetical protein
VQHLEAHNAAERMSDHNGRTRAERLCQHITDSDVERVFIAIRLTPRQVTGDLSEVADQ